MRAVDEQIYVVDAEVTFDQPVPPEVREIVAWAVGNVDCPEGIKPKARWATPARAIASDLGVRARTRQQAVESATGTIRDVVGRSISVPIRSVSILSLKVGTL
jgi:hypothetical protein